MYVILMVTALIATLLLWPIAIYNRLVTLRARTQNSWSQISVQLQRRYDLIPNLVETVKGYMGFEQATLEALVQARTQATGALQAVVREGGPAANAALNPLMSAESNLKSALGNLLALVESYPQLRASESIAQLQEELISTENRIAYARQSYNDQVLLYNAQQQGFPTVLFAELFGHHLVEPYEVTQPIAKEAVKVAF